VTTETIAIAVDHLEMAYGDFVIQRDLRFQIHAGEIFIIMGDSGSGKSTLLRHMIGLQRPAKGEIRYGDISFWRLPEDERRRFSQRFGILYQSGALWSSMTLAQNVTLPLKEHTDYTAKEVAELASFKLSLVGLAGFEDYYPSEISGGMRKRAGLARALALDPAILFFDEPSAGLDPISSRRLDDLILELRDSLGTTVVVARFAQSNTSPFHPSRKGLPYRPTGAGLQFSPWPDRVFRKTIPEEEMWARSFCLK
jgi:phospholipid/cholesterol/gamma-HCH transport system ATP-binding protein